MNTVGMAGLTFLLLSGGLAGAATFDDQGLNVDLSVAPHCVVFPRALREDGKTCSNGLEILGRGMEAKKDPSQGIEPLAVVEFPVGSSTPPQMMIFSSPATTPSFAHVGDFLAASYNELHPDAPVKRRDDPHLAHDTLTISGVPAIRFVTTGPLGLGQIVMYGLYGSRRMYSVSFVCLTGDCKTLGEKVVATVTLPAGAAPEAPVPMARSLGMILGGIVGSLVIVGLLSRILGRFLARDRAGRLLACGIPALLAFGVGTYNQGGLLGAIYLGAGVVWMLIDLRLLELGKL